MNQAPTTDGDDQVRGGPIIATQERRLKFQLVKAEMEKVGNGGEDEVVRLINDPANGHLSSKMTLLHLAARTKSLAIVDLLVAKGAIVDARTGTDWTPLMVACRLGRKEVALCLIHHGADPTLKNSNKDDAIWCAIYGKYLGGVGLGEEGTLEVEAARQEYLDSQEIMLK